jgi:putative membrane protein
MIVDEVIWFQGYRNAVGNAGKNPGRGAASACILLFEEQIIMNFPLLSKRAAAVAGSIVLCGSMGLAQAGQSGAGAGAGAGAGTGGGQAGQPNSASQMDQMNAQQQPQNAAMDKMFVQKAMQGSMAEVQLGQLTLQKSNNEQVKQFAQKMIDDHTKLNEQMKPVAQQLGVKVPDKLSKKDSKNIAKMQSLSGPEYDQAYIKDMVKDHKSDLSDFQTEASNGTDPNVKDAAAQGSKVIAQHLQMVQQLAKDQNITMASK